MTEPEPASLDVRRRRLLYRATHRGTYENDILFGGFVHRHIAALDELELAALEALLEVPDNELADWLTGRLPIPADAETPMLRRVRDEAQSTVSALRRGSVEPPATGDREDGDGRATPGAETKR